jgi:putative endonuclease
MMYYVYALLSLKNKDLYIGFSENIESRLKTHNAGKVKSTKPNRPWVLIYKEMYSERVDAIRREYELKKGYQKKALKEKLYNIIEIEWSRRQVG